MRKSKYSNQADEIVEMFGPCVLKRSFSAMVKEYQFSKKKGYDERGNEERGIYNRLQRVYGNLFVGRGDGLERYNIYSVMPNPSILEISYAFNTPKRYLSHYSAFYLYELTNQKPAEIFISQFASGRTSVHSGSYDPKLAKMLFAKESRSKTKDIKFDQGTVRMLNKNDRGAHFIKQMNPGPWKEFEINVESLEMSLIDSVLNPEFSGGIHAVFEAFEKAPIDLFLLHECYQSNNFFYPYWEVIGFYLSRTKGKDFAQKWKNLFREELEEFFLMHGYRSDWVLDPEWKIWAPKI